MFGCPLAAAAVSSCRVELNRWIAPHLAVRAILTSSGGIVRLLSLFSVLLCGLLLDYLLLIRVECSTSVEVQRVWGICDDRLQFVARFHRFTLKARRENCGAVRQICHFFGKSFTLKCCVC